MGKKPELDNITLPVYEVCHKELEDKSKDIEDVVIPGAIAADKDILGQIVYATEDGITILPKNIMPLKITYRELDGEQYIYSNVYFDYNNSTVLDENNDEFAGLTMEDNQYSIDLDFENEGMEIVSVEYIQFDCIVDRQKLNSYNLYHAPSGGTKLYEHKISDGTNTIYIVNNDNTNYSGSYGVGYNMPEAIVGNVFKNISYRYSNDMVIGTSPNSSGVTIYFIYITDGTSILISNISFGKNITDTVTEL